LIIKLITITATVLQLNCNYATTAAQN